MEIAKVKTVEPVEQYPDGWRSATMYQLIADPTRVCLFFGDKEYEGLDSTSPYTCNLDWGGERYRRWEGT